MRRTGNRATVQGYAIEGVPHSATRLVRRGADKVAILFQPSEPGGPWLLYPHPLTFPGLNFEGLPAPLRPEFMAFAGLDEVEDFLGIAPAHPAALAA